MSEFWKGVRCVHNRLANGCRHCEAVRAEGPARNEPEQSPSLPPGSPSGVVEADLEENRLMALAKWLCGFCRRNQGVDAWDDLAEAGRQVWANDAEALLRFIGTNLRSPAPAAAPVEGRAHG